MNPAVLNYLQNQQTQQPQQPAESQPYNPFDTGIKKAIESARESLGMSRDQEDAAMRRSILAFGNKMATEPKQRGFLKNFGAVGRSLSPAIEAHDEYEDTALKENNALANQILAYGVAEEEKKARAEDREWKKSFAQQQFNEQQRYHNMMSGYQNEKLNLQRQQQNQLESPLAQEGFIPFNSKRDFNTYTKTKNSLGPVMNEIESLSKNYNEFRNKYEGNKIDPMSPAGRFANRPKSIIGRFFNNKDLREESENREILRSEVNRFVTSAEQRLKGGGQIGIGILNYFEEKKLYPDLDHDTPKIFEGKLKAIKELVEKGYEAANLSLKYHSHIDPYEVDKVKDIERADQIEEQQEASPFNVEVPVTEGELNSFPYKTFTNKNGQEVVLMVNPNGDEFGIPPDKVEQMKKTQNLKVVE